MNHRTAAAIFTISLLLPACADDYDVEFRDFSGLGDPGGGNFPGGGYPGLGDYTVYMGEDTSEVGCDIWDFTGGTMSGGTASPLRGLPVLTAYEDPKSAAGFTLVDYNGESSCDFGYCGDELCLSDTSDGTTLLRVDGVFVLPGDYDPATDGSAADNAILTFRDDNVREPGWSGDKLLAATAPIMFTQPWRKLMIGAGVDGLCGAPGLDQAQPPPDHN